MLNNAQQFGRESEAAAARFLEGAGYRVVARNWRHPVGEIDLIAYDGPTLVFVEVKARRSDRFGPAQAAITRRKQDQLTKAALAYLSRQRAAAEPPCRFDLVVVQSRPSQAAPQIELLQDIFSPRSGWKC